MPEAPPATTPPRGPHSPRDLFVACTALALQGFGGVLPVAQRILVEQRGWLDRERFLELLALAQVLPGPNIINLLILLGHGFFGWRGVVAALGGVLLAPLLIVLTLAVLAAGVREQPLVAGALRGMGVVAAALVLSTVIKLAPSLGRNVLGPPACVVIVTLTAVAVGVLRLPLAGVVLGLGLAGGVLAWRRLPR